MEPIASRLLLFLDFDGVLHPDEVYLVKGRPTLKAEGSLFMWAGILAEALSPHPDVDIILSTSWVRWLSFSRTKNFLPPTLQHRVTGATWHSRIDPNDWAELTRHQQIRRYLARHRNKAWVAIDDDDEGWPEAERDRLVHTEPEYGLSDPQKVSRLQLLISKH